MRYAIQTIEKQCACKRCDEPMFISHVAKVDERGNVFCSVSCLEAARVKEAMAQFARTGRE